MRPRNCRSSILSALFGSVSKVSIERMVRYSRTPQLWTMLPTSCEKRSVAVAIDEPSVRYWSEVVNEFAEIEVASSRLPVNAAQKPNAHLILKQMSRPNFLWGNNFFSPVRELSVLFATLLKKK